MIGLWVIAENYKVEVSTQMLVLLLWTNKLSKIIKSGMGIPCPNVLESSFISLQVFEDVRIVNAILDRVGDGVVSPVVYCGLGPLPVGLSLLLY